MRKRRQGTDEPERAMKIVRSGSSVARCSHWAQRRHEPRGVEATTCRLLNPPPSAILELGKHGTRANGELWSQAYRTRELTAVG